MTTTPTTATKHNRRNSLDTSQQAEAQRHAQRPTEGQLRWAQFHHRRRAQQVREKIEALYQTPATLQEVQGAFSEDGNTSSSSSSSAGNDTGIPKRRCKPKVSRGRRALLRVSQRRFRERSEIIRTKGFRRTADYASSSSSSDEEEGKEDFLASIFAETTILKRRRRKKRHGDDRVRRFDEAFHALMMNVAAAQQPQFAHVQTPTKIWTRPVVGETPMMDVNYDAMRQMGISTTVRKKSLLMQPSDFPLVRGASWLVHLPKTEKASNDARRVAAVTNAAFAAAQVVGDNLDDEFQQGPASPVRQRCRDIVSDFQVTSNPLPMPPPPPSLLASPEPNEIRQLPTMRLQKYFAQMEDMDEKKDEGSPLAATRLDFQQIQGRIRAFEQNPQTNEEELDNILRSMDPDFVEEMEALNPGVKERLKALYLCESSPNVKQLARIIETPSSDKPKPRGLVQDFVARMEKATRKEILLSADGKLHKPTFAKLINQYLMEAKGSNVSPRRRQPVLDSLVSKFQESEETDSIIDEEGRLDVPALEHLVTRYLAEVTGQNEEEVLEAEDWESLNTEEYRERPPFIRDTAKHLRNQVMTRAPRGEGEWCEVVEMSMISSLPPNDHVVPPPLLVKRLAERCAALVPEAWEQINTVEEVIESELEEVEKIVDTDADEINTPIKSNNALGYSTPKAKNLAPSPHVQRFVKHLEQAAEVEPLVQDGMFHMPTFAKLVSRYWDETTEDSADFGNLRTPVLLARAKRSSMVAGKAIVPKGVKSPATVKRFISNIEEALRQQQNLVDDTGRLDYVALEELVVQELMKASEKGDEENPTRGHASMEEPSNRYDSKSPLSTQDSDFFSVIRRNRDKTLAAKSVVSELTFDSPSRKATFDNPKGTKFANLNVEMQRVRKATGTMTNKVGGLIGRFFQKDDSNMERNDDMQAVAAFRKTQDERRLSDDTSSLSSFRALPDGIKNVVMNFRRNSAAASEPLRQAEDLMDDGRSFESETLASATRSYSSGGHTEFSPERVKSFHKKVMEKSALIGGGEVSRVIIDTDGSEASFDGSNPDVLASLLLSPTILTKRHQQAIRAIEKRNWDQVEYLISANPWLCEMTDVNTNQYLLHKLSLYGGGESTVDQSTGEVLAMRYPPAPPELNTNMVRLFPSSVHKFDQDGNLPLHMACAAANASMVKTLGDRFPSGATVRNEDGLLPIHLVILACGSPRAASYGDSESACALIKTILSYFPASVAIPDNEGNLPIHTAASVLKGDVGVDVIHLLLDEATRQLSDPEGARFRNRVTIEDLEANSVGTEPTETPTDSSNDFEEVTLCTMVYNDLDETPILSAIHARSGWEVVDALSQGPAGKASALATDRNKNNALHLLVGEFQDPAAALSILKNVPETAHHRNEDGILPIEVRIFLDHAYEENQSLFCLIL